MEVGMKKHLDLGCGLKPRNPYGAELTFGCDIRDIDGAIESIGFEYKKVNLIYDPIPYPNDYFNSISAFDFLEHIPRVISTGTGTRNSFVELMNEIHRVLIPGGVFYAVTPAYPHISAFSDPTHVNFITDQTHYYFTGGNPGAAMYGFTGNFDAIKVEWDTQSNAYTNNTINVRRYMRRLHRKWFRGGLSHLVWEFKACKN
jgi:SAM-dependent methyltransferase